MFNELDVQRDGHISEEELAIGLAKKGLKFSKAQTHALFKHVDQDNDGKLSFDEFKKYLLLAPELENLSQIFEYWSRSRSQS